MPVSKLAWLLVFLVVKSLHRHEVRLRLAAKVSYITDVIVSQIDCCLRHDAEILMDGLATSAVTRGHASAPLGPERQGLLAGSVVVN